MQALPPARSADQAQDPRVFFAEFLPDVIALRRDIFDRAKGRLCLNIPGAGSWVMQFGDHRSAEALREGVDFDADLVVTMSVKSFTQLVRGEALDEKDRQMVCMGDTGLLELFGRLLVEPAKGGLGARLAQF